MGDPDLPPPREPSRHRVAVWRRLKTLGALYLQDGVAALPEDAVTREQLEWLQLRIREAGGKATLWEAAEHRRREQRPRRGVPQPGKSYGKMIEAAHRIRRKAELGGEGASLLEELARTEREFGPSAGGTTSALHCEPRQPKPSALREDAREGAMEREELEEGG